MDLIRSERHLLKEMGFICHVEHPHKFISNYLATLETPPELRQEAWNLANDRYEIWSFYENCNILIFILHVFTTTFTFLIKYHIHLHLQPFCQKGIWMMTSSTLIPFLYFLIKSLTGLNCYK